MKSNLTQRRLAEMLGLSYPTVNRALNGLPGIHQRTRRRIVEAADRLGYRKNIVARSLVLQKTQAIGLVTRINPHSFWSITLENLETRARQLGYHVILSHTGADVRSEDEAIDFLVQRQIDGLILHPNWARNDLSILTQLAQKKTPLLFLGSRLPGVRASFVGLDDIGGAKLACRHFSNLGHRRIAFVAGPQGDSTADRRLAGYRQGMKEAGLPVDDDWIVPADGFDLGDGRRAAFKLLTIRPRPTAVYVVNDPVAFGLALVLREKGVRIPEDIALIGTAGMPEGALLPSPLTTVAPPTTKLGQRAAEIMVQMIESKQPSITSEELPNELLIRESCGAKLQSGNPLSTPGRM